MFVHRAGVISPADSRIKSCKFPKISLCEEFLSGHIIPIIDYKICMAVVNKKG